jgi:hypothetical protein
MNPGNPISFTSLLAIAKGRAFTTRAAAKTYLAGERLECLCCGKSCINLGAHLFRNHGISAREYKSAFNLPRKSALIGTVLHEHLSTTMLQNEANLERVRQMGRVNGPINGVLNHNLDAPHYEDEYENHKPKVNIGVKPKVSIPRSGAGGPSGDLSSSPTDFVSFDDLRPPRTAMQAYDHHSVFARVERIEKTLHIIAFALREFLEDK